MGWEPCGHCCDASLRHALKVAAVRLHMQTRTGRHSLNDGEGAGEQQWLKSLNLVAGKVQDLASQPLPRPLTVSGCQYFPLPTPSILASGHAFDDV